MSENDIASECKKFCSIRNTSLNRTIDPNPGLPLRQQSLPQLPPDKIDPTQDREYFQSFSIREEHIPSLLSWDNFANKIDFLSNNPEIRSIHFVRSRFVRSIHQNETIPTYIFAQWSNPCVKRLPIGFFHDLAYWEKLIQPGTNIIDIGCHGCDYTIPMAAATHGGRTIAFDVSPKASYVCKINAKLNPQLKIEVFNQAVSEKKQKMRYSNVAGECNGNVRPDPNGQILAVNLFDFLKRKYGLNFIQKISFIKIDAEGMDMHIFKGLKKLFEVVKPLFLVEYFALEGHRTCGSAQNKMYWEVSKEFGYQVFDKTGEKLIPDCSSVGEAGDFVLKPK